MEREKISRQAPDAFINFDPIDENESSDKEGERNPLESTIKLGKPNDRAFIR